MGKCYVLLFALSFCSVVNGGSGRHSLWALATYITGETQFPEFSAVLMLDDIQVGYFDSKINKLVKTGHDLDKTQLDIDIAQKAVNALREMHSSMKRRLAIIKHHFNLTAGIYVQQRVTGCEIMENGEPALIMFKEGCNGIDADGLQYNITDFTYTTGNRWQIQWDDMKLTYLQMLFSNICLPICVNILRNFLAIEQSIVMRKVCQRIRFIHKAVSGGGAQVSCLATDFYPRHINLIILRDGQPVPDHVLTGGSLLPNGNGLYQMRKSLEITAEELRERRNYTCSASHLSLDNKLEISWQAEFSRSHRVSILSAPLILMAVVVFLCIFMCVKRRNRYVDSKTLQALAQVDPSSDSSLSEG